MEDAAELQFTILQNANKEKTDKIIMHLRCDGMLKLVLKGSKYKPLAPHQKKKTNKEKTKKLDYKSN